MSTLADRGTGGKDTPGNPVPGVPPVPGRGPRARRKFLIAWAAAGSILVIAAVTVAVLLLAHHPGPVAAPDPLRGTVFQLRSGQCVDTPPNGVAVLRVTPCTAAHGAEIYGVFQVAGQRWPGPAVLARQARTGCMSRLGGYLNPQLATTGLAESYAYPNQGAWDAGARTVVCEVRSTHGLLTGPVRASR